MNTIVREACELASCPAHGIHKLRGCGGDAGGGLEMTYQKCQFDADGVCRALLCYSSEKCNSRRTGGMPNYAYILDIERRMEQEAKRE